MSQIRITQGVLLLAALIGNAAAITHTNKTFVSPRPQNVNTAMEYTTWNQHPYAKHATNIRTHLQATPFYQASQQNTALGKYFGIGNGSNKFIVGNEGQVTNGTADIDANYLIHDYSHPSELAGTVTFDPKQEAFGVRLDFFQDITHPFDKLFFKASAPIIDVTTNMHLGIADGHTTPIGGKNYSLADFFAGNVSVTDKNLYAQDLQTGLDHNKITKSHSEFGVGDLDLGLGYKYLDTESKHVFMSLDITIPTGNKVHSYNLFQPVYGNGKHVGLGGSLDAGINLWKNEKALLKLLGVVRYKYLFENSEHRVIPVKDYKLSEYFLVGKLGAKDVPLVPLANISNFVSVKPGSQLDTMLDLVFNCSKWTIDLGYNMYWRDQESVWLKHFTDDVYAIAKTNYQTNAVFDSTQAVVNLNRSTMDINAAKTPTLFSHKVFAGLGYSFKFYKQYLSSFGIGGSYEFGTSNADLENYALWAKMMFSF